MNRPRSLADLARTASPDNLVRFARDLRNALALLRQPAEAGRFLLAAVYRLARAEPLVTLGVLAWGGAELAGIGWAWAPVALTWVGRWFVYGPETIDPSDFDTITVGAGDDFLDHDSSL